MSRPLSDLDPKFTTVNDLRVGFHFKCPACDDDMCRIHVFVDPPFDASASALMVDQHRAWKRSGEPWDTLTLTPSILTRKDDGGEHWHGFITNGQVTP